MVALIRLSLKIPQICAFILVFASVVYTTNVFVLSPLLSLFLTFLDSILAKSNSQATKYASNLNIPSRPNLLGGAQLSGLAWFSSPFTLQNSLGHSSPVPVEEKTLLSKAFANSMRPSNIKPYFYRAKGTFDSDYITITTLITSNRFEVFARLVEKYRGLSPPFFAFAPLRTGDPLQGLYPWRYISKTFRSMYRKYCTPCTRCTPLPKR